MITTRESSLATAGTETHFVDADAYCCLLLSRRSLVRMDDHVRGLRGVFDPQSHVHYVVEEQKLLALSGVPSADGDSVDP